MADTRVIVRTFGTPVGEMGCGVVLRDGSGAVCMLEFGHRRSLPRERTFLERHYGCAIEDDPSARIPVVDELIDRVREQLGAYFAGERRDFDFPLDTPGTDFQNRVWRALLEIPYGETTSYGELAGAIGSPGGARAVGMANGANRIAIVIPCHRVIESGGGLRGYGGGLERKRFLLDLERGTSGSGTLFEAPTSATA